MAVVAPTTAVIAAMIPVVFAFAIGERLRPMTLAGVGLALVAILLVSLSAPVRNTAADLTRRGFPPGFGLAILSGISVGIFFLSLARTSVAAGMWPLIAARISSVTLFVAIAFTAKRTLVMNRTAAG